LRLGLELRLTLASNIDPIGERGGLTAVIAVLIDEIPDDGFFDPEAASGLGDALTAVVGGEAFGAYVVEQTRAFFAIGLFGGETGMERDELIPVVLEATLRSAVGVHEARVGVGVVGEHDERRVFVEPSREVGGGDIMWNQWFADEALIGVGEERGESGIGGEGSHGACGYEIRTGKREVAKQIAHRSSY
jgi:hypothetical protein